MHQARNVLALSRARRTLTSTPSTVRNLRKRALLTQAEVGAALGVTHAAVSQWEAGNRVPRGDQAVRLLQLLEDAATDSPCQTATARNTK